MSWVDDTLADFQAWYDSGPLDAAAASRALTLALATVETWLDRSLELLERVQEDFSGSGVVLLRAWPVESIDVVTVDPDATLLDLAHITLDARTGRLALGSCYGGVVVSYEGGLDPFPADLEFALWQVAAALVPAVTSSKGAGTGQQISRVSTPDVGSVEFRAGASSGAAGNALLGGILSPAIEATLARYRAESVVGAG